MFSLFKRTYSPRERGLFRFLRKNDLFHFLTDDELSEFLPFLHQREYRASEIVFFRNDPSQALYLVKAGTIGISIDIEGRFEELYTIGPSGFLGENALLANKRRMYHATCLSENAELYVIPRLNLMEIFEDHTEIQAKVMTAFAERQSKLQESLFKAYEASFGFFDLSQVFSKK